MFPASLCALVGQTASLRRVDPHLVGQMANLPYVMPAWSTARARIALRS
jgi:hypothetical protein